MQSHEAQHSRNLIPILSSAILKTPKNSYDSIERDIFKSNRWKFSTILKRDHLEHCSRESKVRFSRVQKSGCPTFQIYVREEQCPFHPCVHRFPWKFALERSRGLINRCRRARSSGTRERTGERFFWWRVATVAVVEETRRKKEVKACTRGRRRMEARALAWTWNGRGARVILAVASRVFHDVLGVPRRFLSASSSLLHRLNADTVNTLSCCLTKGATMATTVTLKMSCLATIPIFNGGVIHCRDVFGRFAGFNWV